MKALAFCLGIRNTVRGLRALFLDFDEKKIPIEARTLLGKLRAGYILLQTTKGYHVISLNLMRKHMWLSMLERFEKYIDPQFYEFSLRNKYSVLRLSPKYSLKDGSVLNPAPKLVSVVESGKYALNPITMLYFTIYNYSPDKARCYKWSEKSKYTVVLEGYMTPSVEVMP